MTRYINKADVVAEIERLKANIKEYCVREGHDRRFDVVPEQLAKILSFIDSLETKEVDLEKEFYDFLDTLIGKDNGHLSEDELFRIAEYFYELGLKTKDE